MTHDEALACWAILAAVAPGQALSESQLEVRAQLIEDMPFQATYEATIDLAKRVRWMPSVAELREMVLVPSLPTASEVWGELLAAVRQRGWPDPPGPGELSPAAERTLRAIGGWTALCESDVRVSQAHVIKIVAPQAIERVRQELVGGQALPELSSPLPAAIDVEVPGAES